MISALTRIVFIVREISACLSDDWLSNTRAEASHSTSSSYNIDDICSSAFYYEYLFSSDIKSKAANDPP